MSAEMPTGTLEQPPAPAVADLSRRYTYAEVCSEFPESNQPCELWEGKLIMSPSPSFYHQKVVLRFYRELHDWVAHRDLGEVIAAPIDMVLSQHNVTQPDVAFIAKERLQLIQRAIMGPADLVAEIVSLGGRTRDRIEKRDLYEQYGVKEYWLIDPEPQTVEVLVLQDGAYRLAMRCGPGQTAESTLLPGFRIDPQPLFQNK